MIMIKKDKRTIRHFLIYLSITVFISILIFENLVPTIEYPGTVFANVDVSAQTDNLEYYFGQLHSHTSDSDGIGTVSDAYNYAKDIAKLDFFAITDHSDYFDVANSSQELNNTSTKWLHGLQIAASKTTPNFVALYGFEMTWYDGGPGHINTFNSDGFVSSNSSFFNEKAFDLGLKEYYELLKKLDGSISQFNHPCELFGTFSDFEYYDKEIGDKIQLIEVGNGGGTIGSDGYYRSYEEYTKALDKGWYLAPTNNQDNHLGKWGDANTARTVILAPSLTEKDLYDAIRKRRVYATEDKNLKIDYRLNGEVMGSILDEIPSQINITANIVQASNVIKRVSVVVTGGKEIGVQEFNTKNINYSFTSNTVQYPYYYLKIEQTNGNIAVTAPIWVGGENRNENIIDSSPNIDDLPPLMPDNAKQEIYERVPWAIPAITTLVQIGAIDGTAGSFRPNDSITRAEFVKMIASMLNLEFDYDGISEFHDVVQGEWYTPYIIASTKAGIVKGLGDGTFGVHKYITRQDIAAIIYRAVKDVIEKGDSIAFSDVDAIADYAADGVRALSKAGIVNGMNDGTFAPLNNATRAEAAKMLAETYKYLLEKTTKMEGANE